MPALAGSLAVILIAVVALQITRPSPASAALAEIVAAAELADPINIPDQSYAYTRSESTVRGVIPPDAFEGRSTPLTYLLPQTREAWVSVDGTVQIRTTAQTPLFFADQDEADYYSAGLDEIDQINEPITLAGTGLTSILDERQWPTTPTELKAAIIESLPTEIAEPLDVAVADLSLSLITETAATPELKTAALRLISSLDDINLDERLPSGGGIFSITYDDPQPTTLSFTLDAAGNVLQITLTDLEGDPTIGLPPGTPIENTKYEPTLIVDSLNATPA